VINLLINSRSGPLNPSLSSGNGGESGGGEEKFLFAISDAGLFQGKNTRPLFFHAQIILYGCDPLDVACDFTRFIDGCLRINESAQLNDALVGLDADLK